MAKNEEEAVASNRGRRQRDIAAEVLGEDAPEQPTVRVRAGTPVHEDTAFDPGEHTVQEVLDYLAEHEDERESVRASEEAGKGRSTLLSALD